MCIDYRILNTNTINDAWLLPCIDDFLARLCTVKFFLKLNLCDRYRQIFTFFFYLFKNCHCQSLWIYGVYSDAVWRKKCIISKQ